MKKIRNKQLAFLKELLNIPLRGADRRRRDEVTDEIIRYGVEFENNVRKIAEENAKKDKDGKIVEDERGVKLDDTENFKKEYELLAEEEVSISNLSWLVEFIKEKEDLFELSYDKSKQLTSIKKMFPDKGECSIK